MIIIITIVQYYQFLQLNFRSSKFYISFLKPYGINMRLGKTAVSLF